MVTPELSDKLLLELDRSLVVDQKTRAYWLTNYRTMPDSAVQFFYDELVRTNQHMDSMVAMGIEANPELGEAINQKGKDAKKKFFKYLETQETREENPEEFLKANLK